MSVKGYGSLKFFPWFGFFRAHNGVWGTPILAYAYTAELSVKFRCNVRTYAYKGTRLHGLLSPKSSVKDYEKYFVYLW